MIKRFRLPVFLSLPARNKAATSGTAGAAILAAAVLFLSACSSEPPPAPTPRLVKVFTVGDRVLADTPMQSDRFETVLVKDPKALSFDGPGVVLEILVAPGDTVVAGQTIARLDPQDLALSESAARTQLAAAQAELLAAEADFNRFSALRDQGFISQAEFDRRKAQLLLARAAFEAKADQLGYLTLRAIAPGRVQKILAKAGDRVAAKQLIAQLLIDQKAAKEFQRASPKAQAKTNLQPNLQPNLQTNLQTNLQNKNGLLIPIAALLGENAVFIIRPQPDGTALIERVPVVLGRIDQESAQVLSGLNAGDQIVAAGVHVLADGDQVRLPAK